MDEDTRRVKEVVWKIMLKANQNTFSVRKHIQRPALKPPLAQSREVDLGRLHEDRWILGSPEEAVDEISRYQEALNPTLLFCRFVYPDLTREDAFRSIRLVGEKLLPKLK